MLGGVAGVPAPAPGRTLHRRHQNAFGGSGGHASQMEGRAPGWSTSGLCVVSRGLGKPHALDQSQNPDEGPGIRPEPGPWDEGPCAPGYWLGQHTLLFEAHSSLRLSEGMWFIPEPVKSTACGLALSQLRVRHVVYP